MNARAHAKRGVWSPLIALFVLLAGPLHAADESPLERARGLEREQKYEEARQAYDEALRDKPKAETAASDWIRLAELHFNLGRNKPDFERTVSILQSVVDSYPADSLDVLRARVKLGEVYERVAEETGKRDALRQANAIYESIAADEAKLTSAGPEAERIRRKELVRYSKRRIEVQRLSASLPAQSLASETLVHVQPRLDAEASEAPEIPQGPARAFAPAQTCPASSRAACAPPAPPLPEDTASANARARRDAAVRIGLLAALVAGAAAIAAVMPTFFPRARPAYGRNHPADNTNLKSKGGHA